MIEPEMTYRDFTEAVVLGNQEVLNYCIVLFEDTPLRETRLIRIRDLEQITKHAKKPMLIKPALFYNEKRNGNEYFTIDEDNKRLTVQELIDNCEGVRLWFKEYHPEHVI